MRALQYAVALTLGVAMTARAQQLAAPAQPTERLLILPLMWSTPADSAGAIALSDAVRDRVNALVKSKVLVVTKAKLCEALAQSGFGCNGLLVEDQAKQLAHFLQVHAYVHGSYSKQGTNLTADVQVFDIGSSGIAGRFAATNGNPGTAAALAELVAQRIAQMVKISEPVRDCNDERRKGRFGPARGAANKALQIDPNSTGAWLCIATVFEAQRAPIDSVIMASQNALKGDSCNGTALEKIASGYLQKGDTAKSTDAYVRQLCAEPRNIPKRLGVAQLLKQMHNTDRAVQVLDEGLKLTPGDPQLLEYKLTICTEAGKYQCSSDVWVAKFQHDTALGGDTAFLKPAIGAAQQVSDTFALGLFTAAAVKHFPRNASYIKARAQYHELVARPDSALIYYKKALAIEPNDVATSLQVAKAIVDGAVWDTAVANHIPKIDSVRLNGMRAAFAQKIDSAKPYLRPGLSSSDSTQRLAASVIMLTAGSKLVQQAQASSYAYPWLDSLLSIIGYQPRTPSDTVGPKHQIRINASFWYGISALPTLSKPFNEVRTMKGSSAVKCKAARDLFDRVSRIGTALQIGRRVHPPTADQMSGYVTQYERTKPQFQAAFKCSPAL